MAHIERRQLPSDPAELGGVEAERKHLADGTVREAALRGVGEGGAERRQQVLRQPLRELLAEAFLEGGL